jgi:DNA-binding MarR family transcriptional regulator
MRLHDTRLRPLGLGMGVMPVLMALADGGALSQKELTELARVEQPTMAETLKRMERDGTVQRRPRADDKRGSVFTLTRSGRARMAKAKEVLLRGERDATVGLSEAEREVLIGLLRRVAANVDRSSEDDRTTTIS